MKITKQYIPKESAGFGKAKAQIYGEHLNKLQKKVKILKPETVVEDAKDKGSPTHEYFEWNNKKAGEKHRLHQARLLLNSIKVKIIYDDNSEGEIRKFHNVKVKVQSDEKERGYVSLENVVKSKDFHSQILEQALLELRGWKQKYEQYSKLRPIIDAIKQVEEEIIRKAA
jgi:hypothetical protein